MRLAPLSCVLPVRRAAKAVLPAGLLLVGGLAAGCGRTPVVSGPAAPEAAAPDNAGFLAPPLPTQAEWMGQGGVAFGGRAPPQAVVSVLSPDGARLTATAGADGRWRMKAPPSPGPRLFSLSAQAGGRVLRGEGALALLPSGAAAPALLLRSGAPALLIGPPAAPALRLVSLDLDAGGGFAVSGAAPPGAAVGLTVDGVAAGQGAADASGRFAVLSIAAPVSHGDHMVAVRAGEGVDARIVGFSPAAPLTAPYRAVATPQGWRIDWAPPGGGVQTLMAFAARPSSAVTAPAKPGAGA